MSETRGRCDQCHWWRDGRRPGECHRVPPACYRVDGEFMTAWPTTDADEGCYEFEQDDELVLFPETGDSVGVRACIEFVSMTSEERLLAPDVWKERTVKMLDTLAAGIDEMLRGRVDAGAMDGMGEEMDDAMEVLSVAAVEVGCKFDEDTNLLAYCRWASSEVQKLSRMVAGFRRVLSDER